MPLFVHAVGVRRYTFACLVPARWSSQAHVLVAGNSRAANAGHSRVGLLGVAQTKNFRTRLAVCCVLRRALHLFFSSTHHHPTAHPKKQAEQA